MKVLDVYNSIVGGIIAVLTFVFGEHWILFALFLLCNAIDFLTGTMKAKITKTESSSAGLIGIVKKFAYWIIILIAFLAAYVFTELGNSFLHIDLSITALFGWFTLATLFINECRSIIENLVEIGVDVPQVLIKGLAVTDRLINGEETENDSD